jgi:hypothetical protein
MVFAARSLSSLSRQDARDYLSSGSKSGGKGEHDFHLVK